MKKILIIGSADLNDGLMFLKGGFEAKNLIVTELRKKEELEKEYGDKFRNNVKELEEKGAKIIFEVDATKLYHEFLYLMCDVDFIFWGCPHFGKDQAIFHETLSEFFFQVELCSRRLKMKAPTIGIALDCLGPDGTFNLSNRFGAFKFPEWSANFLMDMSGFYSFSPTNLVATGRGKLSKVISDNVLTLVYQNNGTIFCGQRDDGKGPYWIDLDSKSDLVHYVNLFRFPIVKFQNFISHFRSNESLLYCYLGDSGKKIWFNLLSNPTRKHPLRPTKILKDMENPMLSDSSKYTWDEIWKLTKGGALMKNYTLSTDINTDKFFSKTSTSDTPTVTGEEKESKVSSSSINTPYSEIRAKISSSHPVHGFTVSSLKIGAETKDQKTETFVPSSYEAAWIAQLPKRPGQEEKEFIAKIPSIAFSDNELTRSGSSLKPALGRLYFEGGRIGRCTEMKRIHNLDAATESAAVTCILGADVCHEGSEHLSSAPTPKKISLPLVATLLAASSSTSPSHSGKRSSSESVGEVRSSERSDVGRTTTSISSLPPAPPPTP